MKRHRYSKHPIFVFLLLLTTTNIGSIKALAATNPQQSDPSAIAWAAKSVTALTGGMPLQSILLQGSVVRTVGPDQEAGLITLHADTNTGTRVDFGLKTGVVSEIYQLNGPMGQWIDNKKQTHSVAGHNLWSEPVWFFPALSQLARYSDASIVFSDLGQEQYQDGSVEHIQVRRTATDMGPEEVRQLAQLSTVD